MFYSTGGVETMTGIAIAATTADLFFTLFGGMAVATTILVSQSLGANKLAEAKDNANKLIKFSMMLAVGFGILMFSTTLIIPHLFRNVSVGSIDIAIQVLKTMSIFFMLYMANAEIYFILRAGGDMKSTLYMDAVFMWCINLPIVGILTYFTKLPIIQVYIIGQMTDILKVSVAFKMFKKERWLKNLTKKEE
jgi:Na+-driven multidrug efflux pump